MTIGIYKITNIIDGKFYIGSSNNIEKRWISHRYHLRHNKHHAEHLNRAWRKYGENSFIFEILEETEQSALIEMEQKYLDKFQSWKPKIGYNNCKIAGSQIGRKHTEKTKKLIGKIHKGKRITQESRERMRQSAIKRAKITEETRKKMSEAQKGREAWNKGIAQEQEVKDKISKARKGKKSNSKGYKWSEEQKSKLKEIRKTGSKNASSRFNKQEVVEIRRMFLEEDKNQTEMSKLFECSRGAIKGALLKYEDVLELKEEVYNKYHKKETK